MSIRSKIIKKFRAREKGVLQISEQKLLHDCAILAKLAETQEWHYGYFIALCKHMVNTSESLGNKVGISEGAGET